MFAASPPKVAAVLAEKAILDLRGPVLRVTGYDVPYPYWQLEDAYMPSVARVLDAVRRLLDFDRPAVPDRHRAARAALLGAGRRTALKDALDSSLDHRPWLPWARNEPQSVEGAAPPEIPRHFDLGQDFVYGIFSSDEAGWSAERAAPARRRGALEIGYWIRESGTGGPRVGGDCRADTGRVRDLRGRPS